ncbi:MoaD/ThiS family protein [Erythrobacter litoralis]|uniref:MoaD/ThiS family protein n=1 Tax=Erythrobacter litoralis TaxID=39960 RepID=UPI002435802A|nr:MoaD/ThiS family protein [Erythrobacter litoralis]MDG6080319.1 MoaD/ThiS family protein [Erythrobacter litoralis]
MAVTIVYLGPLADLAGEAPTSLPAPLDWNTLIDAVGEPLAAQLENDRVHVVCAGKVLADKRQLFAQDGDEVALLPPVSGG